MSIPRLAAALLALSATAAAAQPADLVRVRILAQTPLADISVEALTPLRVESDGREAGRVEPGGALRFRAAGQDVAVTGGGIDARGRSVAVTGGTFKVRAGSTVRTYSGRLRVAADGGRLVVVNDVPMAEYVASVVASEYPFTEIEGVKAQAVLARTYALRRRGALPLYDVTDGQGSQVYRGLEVVTPVARQAAAETAGEVLTYGGALAEAVYSSSSGGHTADNESAWAGAPLPYLRGVPDPYDDQSPDHRWRALVSAEAVHRALSAQFGGRVTGFSVTETSREGRVLRLRLDGAGRAEVTGSEFRRAVNAALGSRTVRSTQFEVSHQGERYVLEGGGFGHGVGMSQYGARGQARAGRAYRDILAFYFQGTEVTTTPGTEGYAAAAAVPASAAEPAPVVRGASEARRWPTPRREARTSWTTPATPETTPAPPRRRAW